MTDKQSDSQANFYAWIKRALFGPEVLSDETREILSASYALTREINHPMQDSRHKATLEEWLTEAVLAHKKEWQR